MSDNDSGFVGTSVQTTGQASELIGRLFKVAEPGAIFSAPVTAGDYTVITATELSIGLGAGFGGGGDDKRGGGSGGGGGGGGVSAGRPVAVISVGPQGVQVEPVVDVTKIAIALFTTLGAMFIGLSQMRRLKRQLRRIER